MNVTNYFKRHVAGTSSQRDTFYFFDDKDEDSIVDAWTAATGMLPGQHARPIVSVWKMPFFTGPWKQLVLVIGVTKDIAIAKPAPTPAPAPEDGKATFVDGVKEPFGVIDYTAARE